MLVAPRETAVEYSVDEAHGTFFILTNADGAKDFKIVTAPVDCARPRELDRPRAARAGPADPLARRLLRGTSSGWSARTACRASSCAGSPTARSTRSPSTRRRIRSGLPAATSSTPTRSASPIRR